MISSRNTYPAYKAVILFYTFIIGATYAAGIVNPGNGGTIQNIIDVTQGGNFFNTVINILWYILDFVRLVLN